MESGTRSIRGSLVIIEFVHSRTFDISRKYARYFPS